MIATTLHSVKPVLARSARSGLPNSFVRAVAARPVTTFRPVAFKQDQEAPQPKAEETQVQKRQAQPKAEETQVQKRQAPGMGASMVAPYARGYGRLPSIFQDMQREMDMLSRSFFDDDFFMAPFRGPLFEELQKVAQPELPALRLATDIEEDDKAFTITADVPGMGKDDIKLKLLNHTLTITGERKEEKREGEEGDKHARYERRYGSFVRSFTLPKNVDAEGITATAKDGVLKVVIPKVEEAKPEAKDIPVSA